MKTNSALLEAAIRKDSNLKKPAKAALTIEEQYRVRYAEGPSALLSEKGADGKRLARFAFDGSYQPFGPYEASSSEALVLVTRALLAHARSAYGNDWERRGAAMLIETAEKTARTLHTHAGKYLQAETGTTYLQVAGQESCKYLSSASAAGQRSVTAGFAHAPKQSAPAKLYLANLRRNNRIVCVAELIAEDDPVLRATFLETGLTEEGYETIRQHFAAAFQNVAPAVDKYLPQMLWPADEGDVALTGVPSLAVYNSINAMHAQVSEDAYLPRASFMVGSGQAQNISVAASSVAGNLPLLRCTPPRIVHTKIQKSVALAYVRQLTGEIPQEAQDRFFVDLNQWPNQSRYRFLQKAARRHVALVFSPAWELRDAIAVGELATDELPESETALMQFARGAHVTPELAQALLPVVLDALENERKSVHTSTSWAYYHDQVRAAILSWKS